MGKKKAKGEYNDFLEDTRYKDNNEIRTTLQTTSGLTRNISPPASSKPQSRQHNSTHNKAKPKKPPLTHFLCLPLVTESNCTQLTTALSNLRHDVEQLTPAPPKAVRPVGTLHLTLGVMSLSGSQLSDATKHLEELDIGLLLRGITTKTIASEASDTRTVSESFGAVTNPTPYLENTALATDPDTLSIDLAGLVAMQKPQQASILYAEPRDASGRLLQFAESVRGSFEEHGWVVRDDRALKLHATLLNTIYAKPKGGRRRLGKGAQGPKVSTNVDVGGMDGEIEGADADSQQGMDGEQGRAGDGERGVTHGLDAKSWMRFDATSLIEAYRDFVWAADVRIDRVQICKMGAKKLLHEETGEVVDERYEVVAEKRI